MAKKKQGTNVRSDSRTGDSPKVTCYKEIPIKDLVIERFQVRKQNVGDSLDELAASIEKYGLLQPIVVCKSGQHLDKWEIVCGQRRYLAHKQILQRPKIMAGIIDHEITYEDGLKLSANENIHRIEMTRKDLIDMCADFFKMYGSIKDVAEETKLPYHIVRQYIRFDALPADLKKKVDYKEINTDLAMKI
jgi:ParB family chromosome partitioning protein